MGKALRNMVQHDVGGGLLLVLMAFLALIIANSPFDHLYQGLLGIPVEVRFGNFYIDKPLLLWVNDGLMALFFFLIGLEVKREILIGKLRSIDQIVLPGVAAIAGIVFPALVYLFFNYSDATKIQGWAIPSATDIAFALGVFALFGKYLPLSLKLFLLSVAIFDDIGAIIIIALFYSQDLATTSLVLASIGLATLFVFNYFSVRSFTGYLLLGIFVWATVLKSGVHATLAGFLVAWFIPLSVKNEKNESMLESTEHSLQPWVAFLVLPLFAFANAGVNLSGLKLYDFIDPVTLGIALGLFVGKQIGVFGVSWLIVKLGWAKLPEGANWLQFYGVSLLCGIGFTMSLFIGSLAFEGADPTVLNQVKVGVLLGSLLSAITGALIISYCNQVCSQVKAPNKLLSNKKVMA